MNVSKEQKQKPSLGVILMGVFIVGTLIAAFAVYGLPQIVNIFREIRIVKEMEDVYAGTNFKNCKCSVKRLNTETVNSGLNSREGYEGDSLYEFTIKDEAFGSASGYATWNGTVIYDNFSDVYYFEQRKEEFFEVIDYENNYSDIIKDIKSDDYTRYLYTKDCKTYEGFKNAKLGQTGFNMGYSMLKVYLSDDSVTEKIDEKLIEAEFPYAVRYYVGDPDDVTGRDIIELPAETKYYPEKSY